MTVSATRPAPDVRTGGRPRVAVGLALATTVLALLGVMAAVAHLGVAVAVDGAADCGEESCVPAIEAELDDPFARAVGVVLAVVTVATVVLLVSWRRGEAGTLLDARPGALAAGLSATAALLGAVLGMAGLWPPGPAGQPQDVETEYAVTGLILFAVGLAAAVAVTRAAGPARVRPSGAELTPAARGTRTR